MAVTIKDVAKKAGVSTATVSKILNNSPTISDATADRVKAIIKELDYHPNRRAQNFARQSTRTILFVAGFGKGDAFKNPHVFESMVGLQSTLMKKNYLLSIVSVTKENCMDILGGIISQKSVDGIVLHISVVTKALEKVIIKEQFPHIVIGCPEYRSKLCWIDNNNILSGEMAASYLLENGYKKIGFIGGLKNDIGSTNRLQGINNLLEQKKIEANQDFFILDQSSIENGTNMMKKLLSLETRPDAVICANNYLALGALNELQSQSIDVPNDMGLITFDAYPFSKITNPKLTTIDIDVYDLGKQAGEIILRKIKKPNLYMQSYTTLANLIINGSTKTKKQK